MHSQRLPNAFGEVVPWSAHLRFSVVACRCRAVVDDWLRHTARATARAPALPDRAKDKRIYAYSLEYADSRVCILSMHTMHRVYYERLLVIILF